MNDSGQITSVLVIGAGIAGLEASLLLAKSGRQVYLVEKNSYIGGNVIKLEDAFPSMECVGCMMAPKLEELLDNKNIKLLRLSQVEAVSGSSGSFSARIKKKAGYVDVEACIACSACFDPCPVEVDNEFEEGLSKRKAIYIPCTGALPAAPVVDTENCLRFKGKECQACQEACAFEAIDFNQQDEEIEIQVGAIIVATGFTSFDPSGISRYGYKKFDNVYSAMEVERICASNGPTQGKIVLKNGQQPKSMAIIHCVGRDEKGYCSSICCMASLKIAHFVKHKLPEVKIVQLYTDLCIPGKNHQKFYEEVKKSGVDFIRATVLGVSQSGNGLDVKYKSEDDKQNTLTVDMVILNPALEAAADSAKLAQILGVPQAEGGFFCEKDPDLGSVVTTQDGIFIAGCAQNPKDIAETIADAEATVGRVLALRT
ncbi:MAG: FAD-dependent oxidoreductase [Dehalococcoidia bacterium]